MTFHFLRPWWLLLVPLAAGLVWLWRRRADPRAQWEARSRPHLLDALLVGGGARVRWRPVHLVAAALALAGVAVAGPTWRKEPPPFGEDAAPLVVAIDLSPTMNATDVAPTRLERVKQKVRDLHAAAPGRADRARRLRRDGAPRAAAGRGPGARRDLPRRARSRVDAGRRQGRGVGARRRAIACSRRRPRRGRSSSSPTAFDAKPDRRPSRSSAEDDAAAGAVLGVGTSKGGPVRAADGGVATDASGRPVQARFDADAPEARCRRRRASRSRASPSTTATSPGSSAARSVTWRRWTRGRPSSAGSESGYWLTLPIGAARARSGSGAAGWCAGGAPIAAALATAAPSRAPASSISSSRPISRAAGASTAATTGRRPATSRTRCGRASRSIAPADYRARVGELARLDSPEAFFLMGNCYARLGDLRARASRRTTTRSQGSSELPGGDARTARSSPELSRSRRRTTSEAAGSEHAPDDVHVRRTGQARQGRQGGRADAATRASGRALDAELEDVAGGFPAREVPDPGRARRRRRHDAIDRGLALVICAALARADDAPRHAGARPPRAGRSRRQRRADGAPCRSTCW